MQQESKNNTAQEGADLSRRCVSAALEHDWRLVQSQALKEPQLMPYCILFQSFLLAGLIEQLFPNNTAEEWSKYLIDQQLEDV